MHKKNTKKLMFFFLSCISLFSFTNLQSVSALTADDVITFGDNYYTDLDGDAILDVVNNFVIHSPTGEEITAKFYFKYYLTLPSGATWYFTDYTKKWQTFESMPMKLEWYDVCLESGDYTFSFEFYMEVKQGNTYDYIITHYVVFDPPAGQTRGGTPSVMVYMG